MATKKRSITNDKSQRPKFQNKSKMKKYQIIYDEDVGSMRCGFMNFLDYSPDLNADIIWEVEPGFEYRTDLISKKFYNTSKYDWVIEQVNNISDPIKDIYTQRTLLIPSMDNIFRMV